MVVTRLFVETITGLTWERSEVNHDSSVDDDNDNGDDGHKMMKMVILVIKLSGGILVSCIFQH